MKLSRLLKIYDMLDVEHRGQGIKKVKRLLKIYDMLDVKHRGHEIRVFRKTTILKLFQHRTYLFMRFYWIVS